MEQSNLLDLAKRGEPDAIAALMNAVLQPKGITAHAEREDDCLKIFLESAKTLNQETLVAFIRKGISELGTEAVNTIIACGKKPTDETWTWTRTFEMRPRNLEELLWLEDEPSETVENLEPIAEDDPLWLSDFEVDETAVSEDIEPVEDDRDVPQEELEEAPAPTGFFSSLKSYWRSYSVPVVLVVIGGFITGGGAAFFLSTSQADSQSHEEVLSKAQTETPEGKQQQAEDYIKAMNAAQEKFYKENNRFANNLEELERSANLMSQSYSYAYRLKVGDQSLITASPRENGLKSYVGAVFVGQSGTKTVICQTQKPSMDAPVPPEFVLAKEQVSCAPRTAKVPS